ncbi:MAG: patatin-like phospholipase family protein [Burkholderiales bacterium]
MKHRTPHGAARARPGKLGLALAGGGPLGGIYEVGALAALADCLEGLDFNALDVYVGVSSGSFIAAGLANGLTPAEMCRLFIESESHDDPFSPELLLRPAVGEYARRAASLPLLLWGSAWRFLTGPGTGAFLASFAQVGRALPTGLFDNDAIDRYLRRLFAVPGRTNDFRALRHKLFLVATDLDSGMPVEFGARGYDHVPISRAVEASAALPGLFPPVEIDGRFYVDGALKRTLHASAALAQGVQLLLCINPLVPYDSRVPVADAHAPRRLVDGGLPVVLAQTLRAIVHSRMQVGMQRYKREFRDADVVLFEPNRHDAEMFFTNVFSYASRRRLAEHAYQKTRKELFARRHALAPLLARHGVGIRLDALTDPDRHLVRGVRRRRPLVRATEVTGRLAESLDDLERWLAGAAAA